MAHVERSDIVAKMEGCHADRQVLKGNHNSLGSLLAFDASDPAGDFDGYRMHRNIPAQMVNENEATAIIGIAFRKLGAVH